MSYDLQIGDADFNITYNVGTMFYEWDAKGIRFLYGLTGAQAVPLLRKLREFFEDNEARLRDMEPANGWGTYEDAFALINLAIRASIARPSETWAGD